MAMQTGGALSPLLVVPIQIHYGWRASFYVFAVVGLAWAVVWFAWFRNSPREKAGVTAAGLKEIEPAVGRHERGFPWGVALRSGNFWAILVMAMSFGYGSYFFIAWLHTYLVRARNFTERDLLLSTLPFIFGACANVGSGAASDFLLRRFGLKAARRWVGVLGLSSGALFATLAAVTTSKTATLVLLCLSLAGISFNQSMTFPICIDVAKKSPGSMSGAMNMVAQLLRTLPFGRFVSDNLQIALPAFMEWTCRMRRRGFCKRRRDHEERRRLYEDNFVRSIACDCSGGRVFSCTVSKKCGVLSQYGAHRSVPYD